LLEATCDRLVILDGDGGVRIHEGRLSDWLRVKKREDAVLEQTEEPAARKPTPRPAKEKPAKAHNPLERMSLRKLEDKIEELELRRTEIDGQLGLPEVYTDGDRVKQLSTERQDLEASLLPLEEEWQRRAESSGQ